MDYNPKQIEPKWRKYWEKNQTYKVEIDYKKPKYYVLDMFPYPSGAGLHVGHPLGYIASDIFARYKRLNGFNVLHPMGYDAFGLPAEQYAIQTGVHPAVATDQNIQSFRQQLDNLGFSFDWSRTVKTCDPDYYKWTQHLFLLLFDHYYDLKQEKALPIQGLIEHFEKKGSQDLEIAETEVLSFTTKDWASYSAAKQDEVLMNYRLAYRKVSYVNWCEDLGTVLANDEVKDGVSERGGYPVIKRPMMQWALRVTAYAKRLLNGLQEVDFSEALKAQQVNWIGRSEGAQIFFQVADQTAQIEVFTTRPDTIFGATFMVLAPEHDLIKMLTSSEQKSKIEEYVSYANSRSEIDRMSEVKHITGAFTGAYAINPFTEEKIPIWISEYVLISYGTGAIMAVPSGDERDARFAKHFDLNIVSVVDQSAYPDASIEDKLGIMVNSGFLNGLDPKTAIKAAIEKLGQLEIGAKQINYRLRDANFSRQRYWGEPFPIKYKDGVTHAETNLPLELPALNNFKPTRDGQPPLARAKTWLNTTDGFTRELDTMPGYAGSSWYFLRYMDANNDLAPFSKAAVNYWQSVDLYVGGAEHAVGHLLYSRFWHKFLHDLEMVPTSEPYKKLVNQGMIQGVIEFLYMMKEKQNGKSVFVSADLIEQEEGTDWVKIPILIDYVSDYGTKHSFLSKDNIEEFKAWRPDYVEAIFQLNSQNQLVTESEVGKMSKRYFNVVNPDRVVDQYGTDCFRMYEMFLGPLEQSKPWSTQGITGVAKFLRKFWSLFFEEDNWQITEEKGDNKELRILHRTIKKVREGLDSFSLNTCVSSFMEATNELKNLKCSKKEILEPLVILIAPFAPHIAEELWTKLGKKSSIHLCDSYPNYNPKYLTVSEIKYPIQIGKRVRAYMVFDVGTSKEDIEKAVLESDEVQRHLEGKTVRKVIVVPKRLVNIVAN